MNKQEFIKNLKNVKIVLGNGFDLHCGLHSKYSDYYCQNWRKYFFIKDSFSKYKNNDIFDLDFNDKMVQSINTWDVFFVMNGPNDPRLLKSDWCDVERLLFSSLISYDEKLSSTDKIALALRSNIHWSIIHGLMFSNSLGTNHIDRYIVEFIKNRSKFICFDYKDFYAYLLKELKDFEKDFGHFIYEQFHDPYFESCSYGTKKVFNSEYSRNVNYTINELCDENNLTSIDSFNYSEIEKPSLKAKFQNVNGSYKNPIFGVDSRFMPNEKQFIFTKTCRRIDADMVDETFQSNPYFENVIIYGHSLDEADYSYFFPLFDKLNLLDSTSNGVIVFVYSIYDEAKKSEIEINFRSRMTRIMLEYAKSKHLTDPERLLDSLSTQKRIVSFSLNNLQVNGFPKSTLDLKWEKIYKELNLVIEEREKNHI